MSSPFALFKWEALFREFGIFAKGFLTTIEISVLALLLALLLGVVFGVLSVTKVKIFKIISRVYVEVIQNIPLVIQIFFLFNGLPYAKIILPVFTIGVVGVGVYHGAYIAEVVRAGITSISDGQFEASYSQGFSYIQTMRYIILPQAIKVIIPPLTNQVVNLIKNTSVLAMIAGGELMYITDSWASESLYYGPAYIVSGALYFALCYPLAMISRKLELKEKNKVSMVSGEELNEIEEELEDVSCV